MSDFTLSIFFTSKTKKVTILAASIVSCLKQHLRYIHEPEKALLLSYNSILTSTQPWKQFHFHEESARWHMHCMVKTNTQNSLLRKALYWSEHLVTCLYYQHVCFKSNQSPKLGFPGSTSGKELTCQCRRHKTSGFNPWVRMIPWRRKWKPTSVFLPGESHGQRSLEGYSPWGHTESDTTERLSMHTKSYIGDDFLSVLGGFFVVVFFNLFCQGRGAVRVVIKNQSW